MKISTTGFPLRIPGFPLPLLLGALFVAPIAAGAQPQPQFVVTRIDDAHDASPGDGICAVEAGGCTLRAAIEETNLNQVWSDGAIRLPAQEQPYTLTLGPITISKNCILMGDDPRTTRIDANRKQGFRISGPGGFNAFFSDLTIYNGYETNPTENGMGGAMEILPGANVNLNRVHLINNGADWRGGAVANRGGATLTLSRCYVAFNSVPKSNGAGQEGEGGAIVNEGVLAAYQTTFHSNQGTKGGAIVNLNRVEMRNCTFVENKATYRGGAVFNASTRILGEPAPSISAAFCTFYRNEVNVAVDPDRMRPPVLECGGGGIYNTGRFSLGNSILAGNLDQRSETFDSYSPDGWSMEYQGTIIDPQTQTLVSTLIKPIFESFRGNVLGIRDPAVLNFADAIWPDLRFDLFGTETDPLEPLLANINENGGGVPTLSLLPGSPALENGTGSTSAGFFDCPATDQRGVPRPPHSGGPNGERCDAGAYEVVPTSGILEAEDGDFFGAFAIGSDPGASGGAYVGTQNGTGDRIAAADEAQRIRFQAYVDESGDYNIMGWARGAAVSDNSFWVKVDGQNAAGYLWDLSPVSNGFEPHFVSHRGSGTEEAPELDPVRFTLSKGMHTIDVYLREDGAQLDRIRLQADDQFSRNLEIESSSMLAGAFMVGGDASASGGKYVSTPISFSNASGIPDDAHKATTVVNAVQAGAYLIRANVHASFDTRNSFWVKVDGMPADGYLWDMTESNTGYGTDYVSHRGNGNSGNPEFDPVELQLAAGPHTIEIYAREGGTRIDRIGLESKQDADMRIVSRNKPATSSSQVSASFAAGKAFDGNAGTRWASLSGDDQWIRLDLQARYRIDRVMLQWDAAYGRDYEIQISEDGASWTALYRKTAGTGGGDNLVLNGTGRYVRMKGAKQGTTAGYSLKEFDVYGTAVTGVFVCQGGCLTAQPVARYQNAVLNTTGESWFVVSEPILGWQASETAGRIISVNGVALQPGQMPLPSRVNGKYYFHFSAGTYSWAAWSFWN